MLFEPHLIQNKQGKPFQVFTPYWKHCLTLLVPPAVKFTETTIATPATWPKSLELAELELRPKIKWDSGLAATWQPGEAGAAALRQAQSEHFVVHVYDNVIRGSGVKT